MTYCLLRDYNILPKKELPLSPWVQITKPPPFGPEEEEEGGDAALIEAGHLASSPTPKRIQEVEPPAPSGLQHSYGVDCRAVRWIYLLDPSRDLGQHLR